MTFSLEGMAASKEFCLCIEEDVGYGMSLQRTSSQLCPWLGILSLSNWSIHQVLLGTEEMPWLAWKQYQMARNYYHAGSCDPSAPPLTLEYPRTNSLQVPSLWFQTCEQDTSLLPSSYGVNFKCPPRFCYYWLDPIGLWWFKVSIPIRWRWQRQCRGESANRLPSKCGCQQTLNNI